MLDEDLTVQDIDVLLAGVDAWLNRHANEDFIGGLLEKTLPGHVAASFSREMAEEKRRRQLGRADEQETAILLKAKLVGLKRRLLASK